MKVYGLWHGGNGYAAPYTDDVELFPSLKRAKIEFDRRLYGGGIFKRDTFYVYRTNEPVFFPLVDLDCEIQLFGSNPAEMSDPYPFAIMRLGPRGGIRVEPA